MAAPVVYPNMDNNTRMPPPNIDYRNSTYDVPGQSRIRPSALHDHYTVQGKKVTVYRNGDKYYNGRDLVLNQKNYRDMDHFLDMITEKIGAVDAVRCIFTPVNGTRVDNLDAIRPNQKLVAARNERFWRIDYSKIGAKNTVVQRKPLERRVQKMPNIQSRLYYRTAPLTIHVFHNGANERPKRVLLIPRIRNNWENIMEEITHKLQANNAVKRLYTAQDFRLITDPSELENGAFYVAVENKALDKSIPYNSTGVSPKPPMQHNRNGGTQRNGTRVKQQRSYAAIHQERGNNDKSKATSRPLPESNRSRFRSRPRQESETFPNKPVKHKRDVRGTETSKQHAPSTEKDDNARSLYRAGRVKQQDTVHAPNVDDRGVYKSKRGNVVAAEVQEDDDTHVDMPIDQIPAETVETEEIFDASAEQRDYEIPDRSHDSPVPTQPSMNEDNTRDIHKSPSRTPSSPTRHRDEDDVLPVEEAVPETTMKSNSMSQEAQKSVEPQKTFKTNSMSEQQVQYGQDDEDDRITVDKLDTVKDESGTSLDGEEEQESIPQELPLLTEAGKDTRSQAVEQPPDEANTNIPDQVVTDKEADITTTEEINESSNEDVSKSSSIHENQDNVQNSMEESTTNAGDTSEPEDKEVQKQTSSLEVEENDLVNKDDVAKQEDDVAKQDEVNTGNDEANETNVVENSLQPNHPTAQETDEEENDLRKPDGVYDDKQEKSAVADESVPQTEEEHPNEDMGSARPDTSTPVVANGNGTLPVGNENQKDVEQNETAVKEVNVSS